jgi:hypothetical protein
MDKRTAFDGRCARCVEVTLDLSARMGTLAALDDCTWRAGRDGLAHWAHAGDDVGICGETVARVSSCERRPRRP